MNQQRMHLPFVVYEARNLFRATPVPPMQSVKNTFPSANVQDVFFELPESEACPHPVTPLRHSIERRFIELLDRLRCAYSRSVTAMTLLSAG